MPPEHPDDPDFKARAGISRRRVMGGMGGMARGLALGPAWATAAPAWAVPTRGKAGLALGVVAAPGSARQAVARAWAARWARQLGQAVTVLDLPASTDVSDWCQQPGRVARAVLATVWQGAVTPAGTCRDRSAGLPPPGLQTLAALAREPLVLIADRFMPRVSSADPAGSRVLVQKALQSAAAPWRCGVDGSDAATLAASLRFLRGLGLGRTEAVEFRGPAQLLPALTGARMPLAVQTAGLCIGSRWEPLSPDLTPGTAEGPVAAHRRGDVQFWAVAERARLPGLPDVPTADEWLGCAGNDIGRWQLLLSPADGEERFMQRLAAAAAATPWRA